MAAAHNLRWVIPFLALLAPAANAGDWTFYRHDLSGTANAGEALRADQARALEVNRYLIGGGVNVSNPIVANGTLYYMGGSYLHAVSLSTFAEVWKKKMNVVAPFPQCVTISEQDPIGAPAVIGNVIYAPGADGVVYALNASDGTQIWATPVADVHNTGAFLWSSIFPANGKLYIGVASIIDCTLVPGQLVQLDPATGAITGIWWGDAQHRDGAGIWTQQAYDPQTNRIFATTGTIGKGLTTADQPWADAFVAIDANTMQTVDWLSPVANDSFGADLDFGASATIYDSPAGVHFMAAADKNGFVYAADRDHLANGILWSYQISGPGAEPDKGNSTIVSAPYADGMLYVAGGETADKSFPGAIAGLDAFTGAEQWLFHPDGFVLPGMTVAGDVLFASATNRSTYRGTLYALDRHSGEVLYELSVAGMFGEPTWANGALYVPDSTGGMYELVPNPAGPQPDFDLQLPGLIGDVAAGGSASFTATVIPKNGFNADVTLAVAKVPSGMTATFTPSVAGPPSYTSQLTISAAPSAVGAYDLSLITGSGGGRTRSAGMWTIGTDYSLSGTPVSAVQGSSGTSTITISPASYASGVTLSASGLPAGTTAAFSSVAAGQSQLTLTTSAATPLGTYSVQVTGTSGTATRTCNVQFNVVQAADFRLQIADPSRDLMAGATGVFEVTVASTAGFPGPFNFSLTGQPPGATFSFAPGPTPDVTELTLSLAPDTHVGLWTISVTATGGGLTRTSSILLTVVPAADFDLTAPASATVARGANTSLSVQITLHGTLTDPVALSVRGLPAGVTATTTPPDASNHATVTLHAAGDAALGTSSATIAASSAGLTHTSPLSVEVVAGALGGGCSTTGATGLGPLVVALLLARRRRNRLSSN